MHIAEAKRTKIIAALGPASDREETPRTVILSRVSAMGAPPLETAAVMPAVVGRAARTRAWLGGEPLGDAMVIVAGAIHRMSGRTNLIKLETVPPKGQIPGGEW